MSLALGRHLDQTLANQMGPLAYAATPVSGAMAPRFKRGFEVVQNVEGNKARISGLDFFDGLPSLPLSLSLGISLGLVLVARQIGVMCGPKNQAKKLIPFRILLQQRLSS